MPTKSRKKSARAKRVKRTEMRHPDGEVHIIEDWLVPNPITKISITIPVDFRVKREEKE